MGIYVKNKVHRSRFHQDDYVWDSHARSVFSMFFQSKGCQVLSNDGSVTGDVDWSATDLKVVFPDGVSCFVEVETKLDAYKDRYLRDGIHFTFRKVYESFHSKKYSPSSVIFGMTNRDGDDFLLVRGQYAHLAYQIWPERDGFGKVAPTPGFVKPAHGCHPLAKYTKRDRNVPEDFCSIAYARADRWHVQPSGKWLKTDPCDKKFLS